MRSKIISCDVLVVGAGISGVAAAVAAAREGAKVILLEKNSFIGGTLVVAMHCYICGLILKGLANEVAKGLRKLDARSKMIPMGRLKAVPFETLNLKSVLKDLLKKEENIRVFLNTRVTLVRKEEGVIVSLKAHGQKHYLEVYPKAVIDASGEGVVIKLSRARQQVSALSRRQLRGFSVRLKGIRSDGDLLEVKIPYFIRKAVLAKKLPRYFKFVTFAYGSNKQEGLLKINVGYNKDFNIGKNALILYNYLKKIIPQFKGSRVIEISPYICDREGLRLLGDYVLTEADVLKCRKFKDSIAQGNWPIEFWHQQQGQKIKYFKKGSFYGIPQRCLHSADIKNLFAAGRCISATQQALASSRVSGICIALGEAAGKAAFKYAHTFS
jgi:hypothetical protein